MIKFFTFQDGVAIYFYTTYFTSVWLWLYAIASLIVKFAYFVGLPLKSIKYVFDIAQKPILALGTVSCLFITLLFIVLAPFVLKGGG